MSKNQVSTVDVYMEYIKLRQSGWAIDDVVRQLTPLADELSKGERQQLSKLVQAWEQRDGQYYKPVSHSDGAAEPAEPVESNRASSKGAAGAIRRIESTGEEKRTTVRRLEPTGPVGDPTQRQLCPNCGKPNHQQDTYCYACGHILESARRAGTRAFGSDELDDRTRWGTAHFGQFSAIVLAIRGVTRPLEMAIQDEAIMGRSDKESPMHPDIDLAPYNAEELGVSRLHAVIKRHENTIAISDLNSKNSTYINGQRLHSNEVRALRDGDEIRLGRLTMKVGFKHQVRRLQEN